MTETPEKQPEPLEVARVEKCRAVKHGVVDLQCEWDRGHEKPQDGKPGTWHEAGFTERREITYPGARHVVVTTEVVTWEPVDHAEEAARHLMASANRSTL
jgi:hypothetical protein